MANKTQLARVSSGKVLAGVCGGIAEYFGWSPTRVRIAYVLASVLSAGFPGAVVYVVLWFLLPQATSPQRTFRVDR